MNAAGLVFLNGRLVPEAEATVPVFDRSFLYGDGLFETVRIADSRPFRWRQHMGRLEDGAEFLGIRVPFSTSDLEAAAVALAERTGMGDGVLRITLSRGVGQRGYSPRGADAPLLAMTLHGSPSSNMAGPSRWRLTMSSLRVATGDPLARFKTCNKLQQVLARREAESRAAGEALLLNTDGELAEGAASNLFWIEAGKVCTPPLSSPVLPGITRGLVLELCTEMGIPVEERRALPRVLREAEGVFMTLSSHGIVEAESLDDVQLRCAPLTQQLREAYQILLSRETGRPPEDQPASPANSHSPFRARIDCSANSRLES